ncbi:MAG: VOC family protein [Acidimicrobiia bacterium]
MDLGLTHIALPVADVDRTVAFYGRYAAMEVVHRRVDPEHSTTVAWLSDHTRPFVIVIIEHAPTDGVLNGAYAHLGVAVASRAEVDTLAAMAVADGVEVYGPVDAGDPVGYYAILRDPDGHNLEISYGQQIGLTVA